MIEEKAIVVSVEDEVAWIETQRKSTCGQCAAKKGCGTAILSNVLGKKRNQLPVAKTLPVKVGDEVVIGIEESALVKGSLAVYAVPLIFLIFFGLLGEVVARQILSTSTDGITVLGAILGFLIGTWWMRLFASQARNDNRYQPKMLRLTRNVVVS